MTKISGIKYGSNAHNSTNQTNFMHRFFITLLSAFLTMNALADTEAQRKEHYNLSGGLAIQGYDPVAYFSGAPKKGNPNFSYKLDGVTYRFASAKNREAFKANPEKYEPQYGGWCAYALSDGNGKVKINPDSYKIIDGKLYLFFSRGFLGNTLKRWNKGSDSQQIVQANKAWSKYIP